MSEVLASEVTEADPHHPRVVSEADHGAPQLAEQHAAVRIRLLGCCGSDGLRQSLCTGVIAVCEEVHVSEAIPTEPPRAGKHAWSCRKQQKHAF